MTEQTSGSTEHPKLYGEQTRRALANFPGHGRSLGDVPQFVRAYGWVKAAAAKANMELGTLDPDRGLAIVEAAQEMADLRLGGEFPTALVQGGGGTSTNMNVNEVLGNRASQLLAGRGSPLVAHPHDHVNRSQSTNDTYPTAMALALRELAEAALVSLEGLAASLDAKAQEYEGLARLGRTCLQDAVPLSVGQGHRAQASAVRRNATSLRLAAEDLCAVPLGATAVGTGVGAPDGYAGVAIRHLSELCGQRLFEPADLFDSLAHLDPYSALSSACVRSGITMAKISADLRILSSGPAGGLGEVTLPALQAGSSIMPGKVNPVIPELVMQLSYRIRGAATTVDLAVAAGELELNVMEPVILDALVTALLDLAAAGDALQEKCIAGLVWNEDRLADNLRGSLHELIEHASDGGYEGASRLHAAKRLEADAASHSSRPSAR